MNGAAPQNRRTSAHTPVSQGSTALVVLVPDAEELVGPFRSRYDPVAHDGSEEELGVIRVGFEEDLVSHGPVRGTASEATLMLHSGTAWVSLDVFEFGSR